jgi:small GTP-binding protein
MTSNTPKIKIAILGERDVGKTALVERWRNKKFEEISRTPTVAVDFVHWTYYATDGASIPVYVWDTAGQERFRCLLQTYVRGSDVIIIVYDVAMRESIESVPYWMRFCKEHASPRVLTILVGNKIDVPFRCIDRRKGIQIAKSHAFDAFLETSAKRGDCIELLFQTAIELVLSDEKSDVDDDRIWRREPTIATDADPEDSTYDFRQMPVSVGGPCNTLYVAQLRRNRCMCSVC